MGQPQFPQVLLGRVVMRTKSETCKQQSAVSSHRASLNPLGLSPLTCPGPVPAPSFLDQEVLVLTMFLCRGLAQLTALL